MNHQQIVVIHYEILIDINVYSKDFLKDYVQNVWEIEQYLKEITKHSQIQVFIASSIRNLNSSHQTEILNSSHLIRASQLSDSIKSSELWSTYDNVTFSLKKMQSQAKADNFVYIYYFEHDTTIRFFNEFFNDATRDLALILLEEVTRINLQYLEGLKLTSLLRNMMNKEVTVTLVLNCCFSESVMCNDFSTRYLSYDHSSCSILLDL